MVNFHPDSRSRPPHLKPFRDGWRHLSLILSTKLRSELALSSDWLPLLFLLLALSTVFAFDDNRGHFYRLGLHQRNSVDAMAIAANISPSKHFLAFLDKRIDSDGNPVYGHYHSFSNAPFALIKLLAILPFPEDLRAQIYAARVLMLLFFSAAALLAYLALCRLFSNRWIALIAVLLAFSSKYLLYYSDSLFVEMPVLFGIMLTFHGMVLFVQEGRFRQLLLKACIAVLLGWQAFALILPFIILGLASELIRAICRSSTLRGLGTALVSLIRSRYLMLGMASFSVGLLVLSYSLTMDYYF